MTPKLYQLLSKDKLLTDDCLDPSDPIKKDFISTGIITLNLQLSAKIDGGVPVGKITTYSAHKQLGKSIIGKILVRNAQKKGFFPVVIDTEYEWDWEQAERIGINCSRESLVVKQENRVEEIQTYIMKLVKGVPVKDRGELFIVLDSWGGLITAEGEKKAEDGKATMDNREVLKKNTLVKYMLNTKCTYYVTNHLYMKIGGYGDPYQAGGGTKIGYLSHCHIIGKSKAKETKESKGEITITGAIVDTKCDKSRCSKEFTEVDYKIDYNNGFNMFYGILEYAIEGGYVSTQKTGHYWRTHIKDDKKYYEKDIYNSDFWIPIFKDTNFKEYLESKFILNNKFDDGSFIESFNDGKETK